LENGPLDEEFVSRYNKGVFKRFLWKLAAAGLLVPAVIFWTSVLMYATLGTDYLFDVVIVPTSKYWWGNFTLIILVLIFPAGAGYLNLAMRARDKRIRSVWFAIIGLFFAILGLLTLFFYK
jgi:hypothetical protein